MQEIFYSSKFTLMILFIFIICLLILALFLKKKILNLNREKDLLQEKLDKVRSFKHDYINTMTSIGGYIKLNDIDGLQNFYSKIFNDISEINLIDSINHSSINDASIYNLVVSKYIIATKEKINFKFYSLFDFKKCNINVYDLSKILGILLDNAIEASKESLEKQIELSFETTKDKTQIIKIRNTYANKELNLDKIYEKDFSTKVIKSGFGLWEVKKIVQNNPNASLNTYKDNMFFTQKLIIKT